MTRQLAPVGSSGGGRRHQTIRRVYRIRALTLLERIESPDRHRVRARLTGAAR
ncbi:hypothetical protein [Plantactinospora alkalitolerans]|uniref:hypothetical protein n=1 Tax=Plantactinospora alkalitolerans TaxID=2789879 RepID=UPI0018AC95B4|nr:hypothetical protein [Plantactinospora alkalitolerans]